MEEEQKIEEDEKSFLYGEFEYGEYIGEYDGKFSGENLGDIVGVFPSLVGEKFGQGFCDTVFAVIRKFKLQ